MATRALQVVITGDTRQLGHSLDRAGRDMGTLEGHIKRSAGRSAKALGALSVAAAGLVAVGLKKSVDAAIEAEKSQAKLQAQLKASGISYRDHAKEIDNVIQRVSRLSGLDDEDLQDSFTNIVRVTGDVNKSLRLTGLAADFARAKHIDVAKAGEIVGKVAGGNTGILSRYGIVLDKNATKAQALAALQQKFAGQADAYGKTTQGSLDRASVASENLGEIVGSKLTPLLAKAATGLVNLVDKAGKLGGPIRTATGSVRTAYDSVVGAVRRFASRNREELQTAAQAMRNLGRAAKYVFEEIILPTVRVAIRRIGPILQNFIGALSGLVRFITNVLTGRWHKAWDALKDTLRNAFQGMGRILLAQIEVLGTLALKIGGAILKGVLKGLGNLGKAIFGKIRSGIDAAAKEALKYVNKVNPFGDIGDGIGQKIGDGVGIGSDGILPSGGAFGGSLMGARTAMRPFAALASRFGLHVTSGRRPGAITSSGNPSWHGTGEAIDLGDGRGPDANKLAFFKTMRSRFGSRLAELIYTPGGVGIKDGRPFRYGGQVAEDHYDHVHVAFDSGKPGLGDGLGRFTATSYGPPWGGIQGTGTTATGVNLHGSPHRYGIAVDPDVIPLGTRVKVSPNPFGYGGFFEAFDTGGAIKGHRIDFYDWRGRTAQNRWGSRTVTVSTDRGCPGRGGGGARGAFQRSQHAATRAVTRAASQAGLTGPGFGGTYEQQVANVGVQRAQAEAHDNLPALIKALRAELAVKRRRLKRINRALKRRLRRETRQRLTEEKSQIISDIAELRGLLKEYRADAAGGATTITAAEGLEAGVAPDTGGDGGELPAPPTAEDFLAKDAALAALTPGLGDDTTVAQKLVDLRKGQLDALLALGGAADPRVVADAAAAYKSAVDALTALKEAVTTETETRQRLIDELAGVRAELKTQNDFSRSVAGIASREAVRALADVISGQIVGRNLQGRRQTAGNGTLALTP